MLLKLWIFGVICLIISMVFSVNRKNYFMRKGMFDSMYLDKKKLEEWEQTKEGKRYNFFWNVFKYIGMLLGIGIPIMIVGYIAIGVLKEIFITALQGKEETMLIAISNFLTSFGAVGILYLLYKLLILFEEKIEDFGKKYSNIAIVIALVFIIVSTLVLPLVAQKIYNDTSDNIIITEQNDIVANVEERQLTIFCEIPTQNVSGYVNGRSSLGYGKIQGETSTQDVLPYWYLPNDNYPAEYDTAPAEYSKLSPIGEGEKPYVKMTTYQNITVIDNQNPWGEREEKVTSEWTEYEFFLPEYIVGGM